MAGCGFSVKGTLIFVSAAGPPYRGKLSKNVNSDNFAPYQFSPFTDRVMGGGGAEILFQSCAVGHLERFWHRQGRLLSDVVQPTFPLLTTALPTVQSTLRDGPEEAVMVHDLPRPCKFPSLDGCQKRFLWTHKEDDLAPHPVVGLLL